ncbi:hypothetical protein AVEN_125280-1 [Araneus ventricosus]|uniref:Uncharacterized protein n=1 Tax=Araneus ventricosus TaxID=182803 RepID=A0A4Y2JJY7_ARAVE|nr:hypothetical protein AVEN_125280-1 [Araneus ventricosus]
MCVGRGYMHSKDLSSRREERQLDIHQRSVPIHLKGFLADRFHFQTTGRTAPPHLRANRSPRLLRLLLLPPLSKRVPRSDFPRMTRPTLSTPHFVVFAFV